MSFLSHSSKKKDKNKSTWGIIVVKSNFIVGFLEELRIPTRPFEINWLLPRKAEIRAENDIIGGPDCTHLGHWKFYP